MKKISDHSGLLYSDDEFVRKLIMEWAPTSYDVDEKSQEHALYAHLKARLPDVPIKTQYGIAWGDADIVLQDQHVIEIKLGFKPKSVGEFDRCLGQLWRYKEKWVDARDGGKVWLVTVGESEAEFRLLLTRYIKSLNDHYALSSPFVWVEVKPPTFRP